MILKHSVAKRPCTWLCKLSSMIEHKYNGLNPLVCAIIRVTGFRLSPLWPFFNSQSMKITEDMWKDFAYRMCKELNLMIVIKKHHSHPNDKPTKVIEFITCNSISGIKGWPISTKILNSWKNIVYNICKFRWSFDRSKNQSENPFFHLHVPTYAVPEKTLIDLDLKGFGDLLKAFNRIWFIIKT